VDVEIELVYKKGNASLKPDGVVYKVKVDGKLTFDEDFIN
jgi:hypothetical protein